MDAIRGAGWINALIRDGRMYALCRGSWMDALSRSGW